MVMQARVNEEKGRAEGYSKLHHDLLDKVRHLTDHNHHLEQEVADILTQVKLLLLKNGDLKLQLDESLHRCEILKSNLGNYTSELSV